MARLLSAAVAIFVCTVALTACDGESVPPAERLPPETYVPLVGAYSTTTEPVYYQSNGFRDLVYTGIGVMVPDSNARYGALRLEIYCAEGELSVALAGIDYAGAGDVEVTLATDLDRPRTHVLASGGRARTGADW